MTAKHFRRDTHTAMAAHKGKFQIQRVVYADNGVATITPLTDWTDFETARLRLEQETKPMDRRLVAKPHCPRATTHIIVFMAFDGRWTFAPDTVRGVSAFNREGEYNTSEEALAAVRADRTIPVGATVTVEPSRVTTHVNRYTIQEA